MITGSSDFWEDVDTVLVATILLIHTTFSERPLHY